MTDSISAALCLDQGGLKEPERSGHLLLLKAGAHIFQGAGRDYGMQTPQNLRGGGDRDGASSRTAETTNTLPRDEKGRATALTSCEWSSRRGRTCSFLRRGFNKGCVRRDSDGNEDAGPWGAGPQGSTWHARSGSKVRGLPHSALRVAKQTDPNSTDASR